MLVHALVISRIDYCNGLYFNLPRNQTERLQRIMRAAARVVAKPRRNDSVTEICKNLHWLPVVERSKFKILTMVYKSLHGLAPGYLQELIVPYEPSRTLRSANSNLLCVDKSRVKFGERAFSRSGPTLWNDLPQEIKLSLIHI